MNIYSMYYENNKQFGFWIKRNCWANVIARNILIFHFWLKNKLNLRLRELIIGRVYSPFNYLERIIVILVCLGLYLEVVFNAQLHIYNITY